VQILYLFDEIPLVRWCVLVDHCNLLILLFQGIQRHWGNPTSL